MRIIVIFNPWANRGGAKKKQPQLEALCREHGFELVCTEKTRDAERLAKEAANKQYDVVVAAGGDGTVHEVVNGLCQSDQRSTRLGVLPIGSGNDLAHGLGIDKDLAKAVQQIKFGTPKAIDLAKIVDENGRFSLADNNLGIGFDAQVVIQTEGITWIGGFLLYLIATLKTFITHYTMLTLDIQFDKEVVQQDALFMALGLGFRGGGGFRLTPDAKNDDNLIDSCTVSPLNQLKALFIMLPKALFGKHTKEKFVAMRKNQKIVIKSTQPMPIHVDGEIFAYPEDNVKHVTITSLPAAVEVMI